MRAPPGGFGHCSRPSPNSDGSCENYQTWTPADAGEKRGDKLPRDMPYVQRTFPAHLGSAVQDLNFTRVVMQARTRQLQRPFTGPKSRLPAQTPEMTPPPGIPFRLIGKPAVTSHPLLGERQATIGHEPHDHDSSVKDVGQRRAEQPPQFQPRREQEDEPDAWLCLLLARSYCLSLVLYAAGTGVAVLSPVASYVLYGTVAVMWFVPDRRLALPQKGV